MTAPQPLPSRLIGALFVERGLVSESQIRIALEIQNETGQQLGQILVERFGVSRKELASVVAEQWAKLGGSAGPEDAASWRRLGEIFVDRGFVTQEELDQALARQRQTGERLGEALVAQGVISKFELAGALAEQMAAPSSLHFAKANEDMAAFGQGISVTVNGITTPNARISGNNRQAAWWKIALTAPDQLRQRVAFALSEILVVSDVNGVLFNNSQGLTNYYDILVRHALRLLAPDEERTMGSLAATIRCDPSNITGIVDRLEARGLVERQKSERDRRRLRLVLTHQGRVALGDARNRIAAHEGAIVARLGPEGAASLVPLLRRIYSRD